MQKIKVAIIGVGNCASALVQGVYYYRDADESKPIPGLMHVRLGGYHVSDIEFVAAFDIAKNKVGKDLSEAIFEKPNCTLKFAEVPKLGVEVMRGMTHDSVGKYLQGVIEKHPSPTVDVVDVLKSTEADLVINYLPVGSEFATKWYVEQALEARVGFINAIPVFIAREKRWQEIFEKRKVPLIGDDVKSQLGATILHRTLAKLFVDRGITIDRMYQLNVGGDTDLYWPKINALAFWMLIPSAILFWSSLLFGYPDITWTLYPPWSVMNKDLAVDVLLIGVLLNGISSVISAINFMMTVFRLRHPSIKISRLPLFVWAFVATIILLIVALPPFALGIVMLLFDRHWGTNFFVGQGDPLLWQNIFWFMGHPEVYILVLPAMGMVSEIIPRMAGRPIFGYKSIAMSSFLIAFISYFVWVHHMFTTPVGTTVTVFFMVSTLAVAVPTGIKVFNWVATLWGGRIRVCTPMVFALGFVSIFIIGGITGVVQGLIPLDYDVHNTFYILGHFHLIVLPIAFAIIGTIYYFFPFITGRMFSEKLSKVAFILMFVGVLGVYLPWLKVGLEGMPRRYYEYPPEYYFWQNISTMFTVVLGIGLLIFFIDVLYSWRRGKPAKEDPWGATKIGLPEFANVTPLLNLNGSAHEAHYPHPYAAFAGILSILAGIGSLLMLEGYLYLGGYILALYAGYLLFWFYKDYISKSSKLATFLSSISLEKLERLKRSDAFIGTMLFVLSESTIFGTAFLSYFYLRAMFPTWPPPGVTPVATGYVLINSIFLFASAFTMQFAYWGLTKGNMKRFKILLIVTLILGSIFIGGQIREYLTSGLSISDGVYGGTFYLITGLHGFHVIVGLVFMAVILAKALKGYFTPERKAMVESATIYWHFVDIVWIFVLSIVYFNLISPPLREVAHTYIWQS